MRGRSAATVLIALLLLACAAAPSAENAGSVRIKDVASLQGTQPMPLIGYGLVVGLNKTGDRRQTIFSAQTLANMLEKLGVVIPGQTIKVENIAAVLVTAELAAFARPGGRIDVTVSSVGDARSLQGGTLTATALRGTDGRVYALAQGALSIGGFGGGSSANSVVVNHLTVGRVPGGAVVQSGQETQLPTDGELLLTMGEPDFSTARRMADAVNAELGPGSARALDSATVAVRVPETYRSSIADLMARIEPLRLDVDVPARVVLNERTGTVVVGENVRIGAAAVAHGNLSVKISTQYNVSQPAPFSERGQTVVTPDERLDVDEGDMKLVELEEGTTLARVVQALNALGATPRDIIAIMQALKAAGALRAELVII